MIGMTISNTEKVLERINKILDVDRLDSNQMPLALSSVSLSSAIEDVLQAQASRLAEKQLDVIRHVPDSLDLVWADGTILERILQNLVDNSIKFTQPGGEILITATAVASEEQPTVHISVADTGSGIPHHLQQTIFDKYSGSAAKGSSGLGLAFCKMALAAHGQDIWAESDEHGTVFTFSLALASQSWRHRQTPVLT
jgi:two-component system phosphate regulon sensor histidine kinase PhoR